MKFSKQITINAPAKKVWEVLGQDFANVSKWATLVANSEVNTEAAVVNDSPVGGRLCNTSIGKISEEFTAYDDKDMSFSFKGVITSKLFSSLISSNKVTAIDENTSEVTATPHIELTFLGMLMYPLIRLQLGGAVSGGLEDLKYYIENGTPSPSKLAAIKKQ
ncbi:SRPBCC family protein [Candidatus Gracilibacteria bacterium]|nr:SRPBCC family protein [Candidatus Gracilibacteria bacterium]